MKDKQTLASFLKAKWGKSKHPEIQHIRRQINRWFTEAERDNKHDAINFNPFDLNMPKVPR